MIRPYLIRVLDYVKLSARTRLGPEDAMCVEFSNELRKATLEGRLNVVWFHPANELCHGHKTGVKAAIARALGMHKGVPDYVFLSSPPIVLEAKSATGRQSDSQKYFQYWCQDAGIAYSVFRSVDEGFELLRKHMVLV